MKQFWLLLPLIIILQGCLYFNDTGISSHLYDNCREYYDDCGIYRKECPSNLIDYTEVGEGLSEIGNEIRATVTGVVQTTDENLPKECRESADTAQ